MWSVDGRRDRCGRCRQVQCPDERRRCAKDMSGSASREVYGFGPAAWKSYKNHHEVPSTDTCSSDRMLFHIHVYFAADKYDVLELRKLAVARFEKAAGKLTDFLPIIPAIRAIYEWSPNSSDPLRQSRVLIILKFLNRDAPNMDKEDLCAVVNAVPAFATDLLSQALKNGFTIQTWNVIDWQD